MSTATVPASVDTDVPANWKDYIEKNREMGRKLAEK